MINLEIDGVVHTVHYEHQARDWVELTVSLPGKRPHAGHSVPAAWWEDASDRSAIRTTGHRYRKA